MQVAHAINPSQQTAASANAVSAPLSNAQQRNVEQHLKRALASLRAALIGITLAAALVRWWAA